MSGEIRFLGKNVEPDRHLCAQQCLTLSESKHVFLAEDKMGYTISSSTSMVVWAYLLLLLSHMDVHIVHNYEYDHVRNSPHSWNDTLLSISRKTYKTMAYYYLLVLLPVPLVE